MDEEREHEDFDDEDTLEDEDCLDEFDFDKMSEEDVETLLLLLVTNHVTDERVDVATFADAGLLRAQ
jgi:hypothetical protein